MGLADLVGHWRRTPAWLLLGFGSAFLFRHLHVRSALPGHSPDGPDAVVLVQMNLRDASAVLQVQCDVPGVDVASPVVDAIPRFTTSIAVQTPEGCADGGGGIDKLQEFLRDAFPLSNVHHESPHSTAFPSIDIGVGNTSSEADSHSLILHRVPLTSSSRSKSMLCSGIRGRLGKWKYNRTYGESSWYVPANGASNGWIRNRELRDGPYNHTSWMWEPDTPDCPMELLSFGGFCEAMHELNTTRLFVLGDSLEFMRLVSFMQLMGLVSSVHTHLNRKPGEKGYMRWSHKLDCPSVGSFSPVDLVFYRTNHLMPVLGNETNPAQWHYHKPEHELFVCYGKRGRPDENGWCPWVKEYLGTSERTLLVSGVGAHFHDLYYYQQSMQNFFDLLRQHKRPNDIVWLRTIHTGHENCTNEKFPVDPLDNFGQYRERYQASARWYGWDQYQLFNRYTEAEVIEIRRDRLWGSAKVELFDIF